MKTTYHNQASIEEKRYPIDFTNSLLSGVTVQSATATHTQYPSGSALTITVNVSTPIVYVNVPTGLVVGAHVVMVAATTSDEALTPVHRLVIVTQA